MQVPQSSNKHAPAYPQKLKFSERKPVSKTSYIPGTRAVHRIGPFIKASQSQFNKLRQFKRFEPFTKFDESVVVSVGYSFIQKILLKVRSNTTLVHKLCLRQNPTAGPRLLTQLSKRKCRIRTLLRLFPSHARPGIHHS